MDNQQNGEINNITAKNSITPEAPGVADNDIWADERGMGSVTNGLNEQETAHYMADERASAQYMGEEALVDDPYALSREEKDVIGEIGNICMGTSATTLSALLTKKVSITTPQVRVAKTVKDLGHYKKSFLAIEVSYTDGVDGYTILLMREHDVKVITDILMGGDGNVDSDMQLDELHFSAISEVMNQMVGAASTSLSNLIMRPVNITPPQIKRIVMEEDDLSTLICSKDIITVTSFVMEIKGVLESELMQLLPFAFSKQLVKEMMEAQGEKAQGTPKTQGAPASLYADAGAHRRKRPRRHKCPCRSSRSANPAYRRFKIRPCRERRHMRIPTLCGMSRAARHGGNHYRKIVWG
ncbi:MAG: flagellar motor switch phosphatase FliY [Clostridiales bacterium]|jgi:chemotaxis protein CheY-P-specific phosphatase CheC|nr:flagellar motor switch phosphatase FliY [Clostridiales bacterium]